MLQVKILPLGVPAPAGVGSVGPVSGYGCGQTPEEARGDAIRQLQIKAMQSRATAVIDVLIESAGGGVCASGNDVTANGIAVAPRGIAPSY